MCNLLNYDMVKVVIIHLYIAMSKKVESLICYSSSKSINEQHRQKKLHSCNTSEDTRHLLTR